jgi:hypothetical protein
LKAIFWGIDQANFYTLLSLCYLEYSNFKIYNIKMKKYPELLLWAFEIMEVLQTDLHLKPFWTH